MFEYQNIKINYYDTRIPKAETLVFLHGWGQNIAMMEPIAKPFANHHRTIIIDLPGHGASEEPKTTWSVEDFADCIHALLTELNIQNPTLIGHSFGGKISLVYASKYQTKKLILLASPYKASQKPVNKKIATLKKLRKIPGMRIIENIVKKRVGSTDYRNATKTMRNILVKHVNTDTQSNAKKIKCPTIIIWGTNDTAVPLKDAYDLEKLISNAGLIIYENATHYAYLEQLQKTIRIIDAFIKSKE